jgi:hypothetical protein
LWREPLLIEHLAALRHPLFEYKGAMKILGDAALQPVVPFAALGAFAWLSGRDSRKLQFAMYALVAWLVAIITIPQVGGNINYFQEPLLVSSVLAGAGLIRLQQSVQRTPALVALALMVLLLRAFLPVLHDNVASLRKVRSYVDPKAYAARKREWNSFVAMLSGRRLLSTLPDVAVHSTTPEIPDPYLNHVLEIRGMWDFAPVAARIDADVYDLIVLRKGEAGRVEFWRGLSVWNDKMWRALLRAYKPFCEFENMEVWLPRKRPSPVISQLSTVGCHPGTGPLVDYGDPTVQFQ